MSVKDTARRLTIILAVFAAVFSVQGGADVGSNSHYETFDHQDGHSRDSLMPTESGEITFADNVGESPEFITADWIDSKETNHRRKFLSLLAPEVLEEYTKDLFIRESKPDARRLDNRNETLQKWDPKCQTSKQQSGSLLKRLSRILAISDPGTRQLLLFNMEPEMKLFRHVLKSSRGEAGILDEDIDCVLKFVSPRSEEAIKAKNCPAFGKKFLGLNIISDKLKDIIQSRMKDDFRGIKRQLLYFGRELQSHIKQNDSRSRDSEELAEKIIDAAYYPYYNHRNFWPLVERANMLKGNLSGKTKEYCEKAEEMLRSAAIGEEIFERDVKAVQCIFERSLTKFQSSGVSPKEILLNSFLDVLKSSAARSAKKLFTILHRNDVEMLAKLMRFEGKYHDVLRELEGYADVWRC